MTDFQAARSASRIVLASTSPYRRELLARLGWPFDIVSPGVDESCAPGEMPRETAQRLAAEKALAGAAICADALVIGSDQTATLDDIVAIGKPGSHARATEQLRSASGRAMRFYTALAVWWPGLEQPRIDCVTTLVRFRQLAPDEIEAYLRAEQPYDCAGSAKSEGLGISLLESIEGDDPTALVGLPLIRLAHRLREAGFGLPDRGQ